MNQNLSVVDVMSGELESMSFSHLPNSKTVHLKTGRSFLNRSNTTAGSSKGAGDPR